MFCSRQTNSMINKIHGKAFRIVLNHHISDFETMFRNINGITIHHRNIQTLMIELFKIKYDLAPPIMLNRRTICYNFRNLQEVQSERKRTVFYGLETVLWFIYICLALSEDTFNWEYTSACCYLTCISLHYPFYQFKFFHFIIFFVADVN